MTVNGELFQKKKYPYNNRRVRGYGTKFVWAQYTNNHQTTKSVTRTTRLTDTCSQKRQYFII